MNPKVTQTQGSLIRLMASKKKPSSIDLGLGEPTLSPNYEHLRFAMEYVGLQGVRYTPNAGDPELRRAIAEHYRYPGMEQPENVCVTTGSQEAMYVTIKTLLDPSRDELLIVEPAFASYVKMATLEGVPIRSVAMRDTDDFAFDAERILAAIGENTRAIIVCSPCNPTARVLTQTEARKLVRGLEKRSGDPIWLIHDEVYREGIFVDDAADLGRMYPHTIVTNSLSKSNALTGLRLGWLIAPESFINEAIKCHAWVTSCADTFAQAVARHIFETRGGIEEHTGWYREQRKSLLEILNAAGLRHLPIDGTFYTCIHIPPEHISKFPQGRTSFDISLAMLEDIDVVTIPGRAFGVSFDRWLRLSWVADIERLREGLTRITNYFH